MKKFLILDCFLFTLVGEDTVVAGAFGFSSDWTFLGGDGVGVGDGVSVGEEKSFCVKWWGYLM